jgi:hypothetical protein
MSKRAALRLVSDRTPTPLFGSTRKKRAPKHRKFLTEAEVELLAKRPPIIAIARCSW